MAPASPKTEFAGRLLQALRATGIRQQTVAEEAGLGGRQAIQPYLTGRVEPTLRRVEQFAQALQVEPGWLAGWQEVGGPRPPDAEPLDGSDFEAAVRALYRYAWRQCLDPSAVPWDPSEHRAYYRREERTAKAACKHALKNGENRRGCRVRLPSCTLSYKIKSSIFLRDESGFIAEVRTKDRFIPWGKSPSRRSPITMWVVPSTARRILQD